MRKFLKFILVIQEKRIESKHGNKKIGKIFRTYHRINPYNPLSYISIVIIVLVGILMFGFIGVWKEVDLKNPFKWS